MLGQPALSDKITRNLQGIVKYLTYPLTPRDWKPAHRQNNRLL